MKNNLNEVLEKLKRLPQVVLPKDASLILAYTGIPPNAKIVDAGSGSGFLAIFLAWYCPNGKVVTYEKRKEFAKVVEENVKKSGLKNILVKNKDILKGFSEKNLDLITLDMKDCEKVIPEAYKKLKKGGWLVVYSPHVEQVIDVMNEMKRSGFEDVKCVENTVREWQSNYGYTRPKTQGIMHTGWLTFGKK
ncbi:MAG: methyltransferase domain-containing protein [Candidatus Aenigmarchaeota archaeon]|nr:methyltransferase domain-containing protein [Candidatus Aenigmarchaeota archaeon]